MATTIERAWPREATTFNKRYFGLYAWAVLAYNILVVLWGAYVRATGAGAGCGNHWPFCNSQVIPRAPQVNTMVEFSHRVTSGAAIISLVLLCVFAYRIYGRGHVVWRTSVVSLALIFVEALLGAGLVLLRYVGTDASLARAAYLSAHLTNTLLLLGALGMVAWLAADEQPLRSWKRAPGWLVAALPVALVIGITGAIAALGDTLFPATSLLAGIRQDFEASSHFLIRLRLLHPVIAVSGGLYAAGVAFVMLKREADRQSGPAVAVIIITLVQFLLGGLNVALRAPVWMQLMHLLTADLLWLALVFLVLDQMRSRNSAVVRTL